MKARCVLCDTIDVISDDNPLAKKLRNRPIHTYMCEACHTRITDRTIERTSSDHYRSYKDIQPKEDW
ncbi:YlaI family protein [Salsuginibacillus kocurii]|uniref:YlaI family protein n=1 Tax=Salsuginibacillus kocurii TaxID=427078 RepID=UPI0003A6E2A3|nr:YlaI family protein [Salsuginibacillus kocurii]